MPIEYDQKKRDPYGEILDPKAELSTHSVNAMVRLMTARTYWKVPSDILEEFPGRLVKYIRTLDPTKQLSAYDKAMRLLMKMIDQNIAQARQEVQFLGPRAGELSAPSEATEAAPEAPQQIAHLETPTLQDAAKTAQILHDLGIFTDIAKGTAEQPDNVVEGQARERSSGDSEPSE